MASKKKMCLKPKPLQKNRFFEQMSSIKTRKHYVIFDMAFSGLWAFFYFVTFIYMCVTWSQTEIRFNFASSNIIGAIIFAFFSVFAWVNLFFEESGFATF